MPAGRPTKYDPSMLKDMIALFSEGASKTEIAASLGITRETFNVWQKNNQDFSDAVKEGEELSKSWWEKHGRTQLENKNFNAVLWYMNMKNRFGWRDKQDITSNDETITFSIKNV